MAISAERDGRVLVITAEGRIDGSNSAAFLDSIQGVIDDQDKAVVLDFENIAYISSAGLRVILLLAKELREKSAGFGICSLSSSVHEIFMISGFDQIINIHESSAAAVAALKN